MNISKKLKGLLAASVAAVGLTAFAEPMVTVDKVETYQPWSKIGVTYTLGGTDSTLNYKVAFDVTADGQTASVTNDAAKLTDGVATKVIDTAQLFGKQIADIKAKVRVSLIAIKPLGGVQLWADGPYFAECNLGAETPTDYGWYFWWGDTVGYKRNEADNGWVSVVDGKAIRFNSSDKTVSLTFRKDSATLKAEGWIDDSGNLAPEHDAATVKLGSPWRMMTGAELQKLADTAICKHEWKENYKGTGVNGYLVMGVTEGYEAKSIFLPASGYGHSDILGILGQEGCYWSASPSPETTGNAWFCYFDSDGLYRYDFQDSTHGLLVRPVR